MLANLRICVNSSRRCLRSAFLLGIAIATAAYRGSDKHSFLYSILAIIIILAFLYFTIDAVYSA